MNPIYSRRSVALAGAFLAIVLAIRTMIAIWMQGDLAEDPDAYGRLAEAWRRSGTFGLLDEHGFPHPTAFRPPLYPWLIHFLVVDHQLKLEWVAGLHLALSLASACFIAAIAKRIGLSLYMSAIVAALSLLDPIAIKQSSLLMTETLTTSLGLLAWYLWCSVSVKPKNSSHEREPPAQRSSWLPGSLVLGLVLGLSALCRPTALPWIGLWMVAVLFQQRFTLFQRWSWCLMVTLAVSICVGAWAIRNQQVLGHPVTMTTHGGYTLFLANNNFLYDHFEQHGPSRVWNDQAFHDQWKDLQAAASDRSEDGLDRLANQQAIETIRHRPGDFLKSCIYRVGWLWAWWPSSVNGEWYIRWAIGCWYAFWTVAAACGGLEVWCFRRDRYQQQRWQLLPALCLALSLTMIHAIYWSNMRMRAPVMPAIYLVATLVITNRFTRADFRSKVE